MPIAVVTTDDVFCNSKYSS